MNSPLRVALIGCGSISRNHISAILQNGCRICALCDILPERAEAKVDHYGLENVAIYTDYKRLLDEERPDIVHICTPHYLHAPMAIYALDRNINVLCEKPLCISMEQLNDLREAERRSSAQLGVCHQNRYEPNMIRARELSADGIASAFASVVWNRDKSYYDSAEWRGTWSQEGGGVLINQALHTLDLMQLICGFPQSVVAHVHNDLHKGIIEVEDTAVACFQCENGLRFNMFATLTSGADLPIQIQLKLKNGDQIDVQNDQLCLNHEQIGEKKNEVIVGKKVWGGGHKALINDFYRHVAQGTRFPIDVEESGKVIRLILSVYASNGSEIQIFN